MKALHVETKYRTVEVQIDDLDYGLLALQLQLDPQDLGTRRQIEAWLRVKVSDHRDIILVMQPEEAVRAEVTRGIADPALVDGLRQARHGSSECAALCHDPRADGDSDAYVVYHKGQWITYHADRIVTDLLAIMLEEVPRTALAKARIGAWLQEVAYELRGVDADTLPRLLDEQVLLWISDRQLGHAYEQWQHDRQAARGNRAASAGDPALELIGG